MINIDMDLNKRVSDSTNVQWVLGIFITCSFTETT